MNKSVMIFEHESLIFGIICRLQLAYSRKKTQNKIEDMQ